MKPQKKIVLTQALRMLLGGAFLLGAISTSGRRIKALDPELMAAAEAKRQRKRDRNLRNGM